MAALVFLLKWGSDILQMLKDGSGMVKVIFGSFDMKSAKHPKPVEFLRSQQNFSEVSRISPKSAEFSEVSRSSHCTEVRKQNLSTLLNFYANKFAATTRLTNYTCVQTKCGVRDKDRTMRDVCVCGRASDLW